MVKIRHIFNWITQQKFSFLAYMTGIIVFLIGIEKVPHEGYSHSELIASLLFAIGVIYDSINILNILHNTIYEKFLYLIFAILTFFTYIQAESFAKHAIYTEVKVNPDFFSTSVAHLSGIFFLPSFFLILANFLVFSIIVASILIISFPLFNRTKKILLSPNLALHSGFYILGFIVVVFGFFNLNFGESKNYIFGKNYVLSHIIAKDFYLNKTCENIPSVYIKYLEDNIVSVTNITYFQNPLLWSSSIDNNVTFTLMKCEQAIQK